MKTKDPGGQQSSGVPDCCTNHILPTGNLDSNTSQEVLGLMVESVHMLNQTLIMITHNMQIAQMADRIIYIEDGKIVER